MSRSRLGAEIAFFCNLPCQPTERSEARRGSAQLSLIGGARATPVKLNWLISQPDRTDGRRSSELQLAVRPIGADNLDKRHKPFGSEFICLLGVPEREIPAAASHQRHLFTRRKTKPEQSWLTGYRYPFYDQ